MQNDRKRNDETGAAEITDLPAEQGTAEQVTDEQANDVRGGKVSHQDFHFVMRTNSASPTLMG